MIVRTRSTCSHTSIEFRSTSIMIRENDTKLDLINYTSRCSHGTCSCVLQIICSYAVPTGLPPDIRGSPQPVWPGVLFHNSNGHKPLMFCHTLVASSLKFLPATNASALKPLVPDLNSEQWIRARHHSYECAKYLTGISQADVLAMNI